MSRVALRRRLLGSLLLPTVLWSAVPAIRWCSLRWDQVCPQMVLRCVTVMAHVADTCQEPECPLARSSRGEGVAPAAAAAEEPECSAGGACPIAAETPAPEGSEARGSTTSDANAPATSHGRAYCLGDPVGGPGLRNRVARVAPPMPLALLVAVVALQPPANESHWPRPESNARPPTRSWAALPPIRAPPGKAHA